MRLIASPFRLAETAVFVLLSLHPCHIPADLRLLLSSLPNREFLFYQRRAARLIFYDRVIGLLTVFVRPFDKQFIIQDLIF